jgi:hypothetical protein
VEATTGCLRNPAQAADRHAGLLLTIAAAVLLLVGCVPQTPDVDTWRYDARLAVGDVASQLATDELVLRHEMGAGLLGKYENVVTAQAEETAGRSAQLFTAKQPPDQELQRYRTVSDELSSATGLLSEVRIAVVRDDTAAYPHLLRRLEDAGKRLGDLAEQLHGPAPRASG